LTRFKRAILTELQKSEAAQTETAAYARGHMQAARAADARRHEETVKPGRRQIFLKKVLTRFRPFN
jgi:hypothetical protein